VGTTNDIDPNPLNQNGWREILFDGFNDTSVNRNIWHNLYGGSGNGGAFTWVHSAVTEGNGELTISTINTGNGWVSGGLSQGWEGETYGRFEVRAKVDWGPGTAGAILLWPSDDSWPPEVDILETPGRNRDTASFTNHWAGAGGRDTYESHDFGVDVSQWHTYALDWTADRLTYSIDGRQMFTTTQNVPHQPMSLGLMGWVAQPGDAWFGGAPGAGTPNQVDMHVDWVRISAPNGSGQPSTPAATAHADPVTKATATAAADIAPAADVPSWALTPEQRWWDHGGADPAAAIVADVTAAVDTRPSWALSPEERWWDIA